jgi:hypothetical protein
MPPSLPVLLVLVRDVRENLARLGLGTYNARTSSLNPLAMWRKLRDDRTNARDH